MLLDPKANKTYVTACLASKANASDVYSKGDIEQKTASTADLDQATSLLQLKTHVDDTIAN